MAKELLVSNQLTQEMIDTGDDLVKLLDSASAAPTAAFWIYESEPEEWKMIIVSPLVKNEGPNLFYKRIQDLYTDLADNKVYLPLSYIWLATEDSSIVQLLSMLIQTGDEISGVRCTRNTINGHVIEDAYIYRMNTKKT